MDPLVREIEELAFRAWPAARVENVDGWRVRYTSGVTGRANSVWPNARGGSLSLEAALQRVESFYAGVGLPARYQLTPAARPSGLDGELAARGYEVVSPVSIQVASCQEVLAHAPRPDAAKAEVSGQLTDPWFDVAGRRGRFRDVLDVYRGILDRIGTRAGFALGWLDGEPVGAALGVREAGWAGVFGMATLPPFRRRGVGAALLSALADWGAAGGADRLYLQVERDNPAALALYAGAGFREVYGYHYRVGGGVQKP